MLLGGAVLTGVLDLGPVADERALRWHVLLRDAWFLVWGLALLVAAGSVRSSSGRRSSTGPAEPAAVMSRLRSAVRNRRTPAVPSPQLLRRGRGRGQRCTSPTARLWSAPVT